MSGEKTLGMFLPLPPALSLGTVRAEGPALLWTGSEIAKQGSEQICAESLLKGTFAYSYMAGWEMPCSTQAIPLIEPRLRNTQAIPLIKPCLPNSGFVPKRLRSRTERSAAGQHSNWTKCFGQHLIFFPQRMLVLPQALTALALGRTSEVTFSHFFVGAFACETRRL